jgi:Flp pilus assembly protein TadD
MADRYTYIPLVGLFIVVVWGGGEISGTWRRGVPLVAGVSVVALVLLSVLTAAQIRLWQNSYSVYAHDLAVVDRNWLAHNNMGILMAQQYRTEEAIHHFRESLRIFPNQPTGFRNLGNAYQSAGNNAAAIEAFREAVRLNPNDGEGHFRLGYAYLMAGNLDLAYQEYLVLRRLDESQARPLLDSIELRKKR